MTTPVGPDSRIGHSSQQAAFGSCGRATTFRGNRFHLAPAIWSLGRAGLS
jgi:hypothetical protein